MNSGRAKCFNALQLEATLEALRQELKRKEASESDVMVRIRLELKEAQQQQETAVMKKKQLRDQLREATRALHLTRVRNEEVQTGTIVAEFRYLRWRVWDFELRRRWRLARLAAMLYTR